jgi:hypothetical protein
MKSPLSREQRLTLVYAVLGLVLTLVVLQLWLLTATMNAYLGGDDSVIWPAALASLLCLAASGSLLRALYAGERPAASSPGQDTPAPPQ